MSVIKLKMGVVDNINRQIVDIPVLIDENGQPFLALIKYCMEVFVGSSIRISSIKQAVYGVKLYLDFAYANRDQCQNSQELFKRFFYSLDKGTIDDEGFDPTGLYWYGWSENTKTIYTQAVSYFSDWLHENYGNELLNPLVRADYRTQVILYYAYYYKQKNNILSHIDSEQNKDKNNYTRALRTHKSVRKESGDEQQFPLHLFIKLMKYGFKNVRDLRAALRDKLILLLMHGTGLRESEALHLWAIDVDMMTRTVKIFHPQMGEAPNRWKSKFSQKFDREQYLKEVYSLKPRTVLNNNQNLGWKSKVVDSQGALPLLWYSQEIKNLFFKLWEVYLLEIASLKLNHPYAFINFNKKDFGEPYTLSSFNKNYEVAMAKIDTEVSKSLGTSTHGHRHNYAMTLKRMGVNPRIIQRALHHSSIDSQITYTSESQAKALKSFSEIEQELNKHKNPHEDISWDELLKFHY